MRAAGPAPLRLLAGSFLALILAGSALLKLPAATPPDQPIGWIDALFTATSATCVTGLAVRDTGTGFTSFGQAVILTLIQLGGLGIMTFSLFVLALFGRKVSLAQRSILEQTVSSSIGNDLRPLLKLVFLFTFGSEAVGALLLYVRWAPAMGAAEAVWPAVFHSISAFCNAGFGLWRDSLTPWRGDPWTVLTVSALIIFGGLGFLTVSEIRRAPKLRSRLSVHSRLALVVSVLLTVLGTVAFFLLETNRAFRDLPLGEQILAAFFQSVTTRTAGFNTVDIGALAPGTLFLMMILMFIGGSPGSCAGGIKTTTLGVLAVATATRLKGLRNVNVFARTLTPVTVRNALTLSLFGAAVVIAGLFALLLLEVPGRTLEEERALFIDYLFETVSALGTVGLSTGITADLSPASRLLVSLLMFLGRLGPLTIGAAVAGAGGSHDWQYPEEEVMVG
ncbi:MAG TPA: TrkH family potassium uptake protein [Thermoanaerobaculia bacterium]|nr:TrkH family potassium uptake protein [Thermoanaerobaculia bacterium]